MAGAKRLGVLAGLMALWSTVLCAPALAHAGIVSASPEYDETVPRPPGQVRITFNERVTAEFSPLEVYDEGGDRVDRDDARTDPDDTTVLVASLKPGLPAGDYRVEWRATSADGHPIDGNYRFTARNGAQGGAGNGPLDESDGGVQDPLEEPTAGQEGIGVLAPVAVLGVVAVVVGAGVLLLRRGKP